MWFQDYYTSKNDIKKLCQKKKYLHPDTPGGECGCDQSSFLWYSYPGKNTLKGRLVFFTCKYKHGRRFHFAFIKMAVCLFEVTDKEKIQDE